MKGGCLCGSVRYETIAAPQYSGFCHCRDCQKATGTGHSCYMIFSRSDFSWSGDVRSYAVTGESGQPSYRHFCPTCGSIVLGSGPDGDDRWTIYGGTLDDPSEFVPQDAIMTRSRQPWDHMAGNLPEFEGMPE